METEKSNTKIAIIPARGGSKRIPRKNIKEFLGKPIIAYSIEAAIKSELFDEVMVSTDDEEIAEISKKYGASVPFFRSKDTSNDFATTSDVLLEVLEKYKSYKKCFNFFCCIYPCAPFITSGKLKVTFDILNKSNSESLIPVVKFSYPIQRAFRIKDEVLNFIYPDSINKRTQDMEEAFHDAGQFYWMKTKAFLQNISLLTDKTMPYILSEKEVQDIDNEEDWSIAEIKIEIINKKIAD